MNCLRVIYLYRSNITFDNLAPLSNYLGKPGNIELGGIPIAEYEKRQEQHRKAEVAALLDTGYFASRSKEIYQYNNFICDSGGSICEVVNPDDPNDPVMMPFVREYSVSMDKRVRCPYRSTDKQV